MTELNLSTSTNTTIITKPRSDYKIGFWFMKEEEKTVVTRINPDSPASRTTLRVGDVILSVNGMECHGRDKAEVLKLLKSASDSVVLVTETPVDLMEIVSPRKNTKTVTIEKSSPDAKLGVRLESKTHGVVISYIDPEGLIYRTSIEVGDVLLSVNGVDTFGEEEGSILEMLKSSRESITLVLETPFRVVGSVPLGRSTTTTILRSDSNTKLGLRFISEDGDIIVTRINPDGLVSQTSIHVGDVIVSVNGIYCYGKSIRQVLAILSPSHGSVTIETETPVKVMGTIPRNNRVTTKITKPDRCSKLGVWFKSINHEIVVSGIKKQGLVSCTRIQVGDIIVSVNGIDCFGKGITEVCAMLAASDHEVIIVTEN